MELKDETLNLSIIFLDQPGSIKVNNGKKWMLKVQIWYRKRLLNHQRH